MLKQQVGMPGRNVPSEEDLREPQWRDGVQTEIQKPSDKLRSCKICLCISYRCRILITCLKNIQKILIHIKKILIVSIEQSNKTMTL